MKKSIIFAFLFFLFFLLLLLFFFLLFLWVFYFVFCFCLFVALVVVVHFVCFLNHLRALAVPHQNFVTDTFAETGSGNLEQCLWSVSTGVMNYGKPERVLPLSLWHWQRQPSPPSPLPPPSKPRRPCHRHALAHREKSRVCFVVRSNRSKRCV